MSGASRCRIDALGAFFVLDAPKHPSTARTELVPQSPPRSTGTVRTQTLRCCGDLRCAPDRSASTGSSDEPNIRYGPHCVAPGSALGALSSWAEKRVSVALRHLRAVCVPGRAVRVRRCAAELYCILAGAFARSSSMAAAIAMYKIAFKPRSGVLRSVPHRRKQ